MLWLKKLMPSFLYSMLMTGVIMDSNPGAMRAIKDIEKWKKEYVRLK